MLPSGHPVGPAPKEKAMPTAPPPDAASKLRWHAAPPRPAPVEYPESDGKPMAETDIHRRVIIDVATMLSTRYRGREDMFVGGDLMMYYEEGAPNLSVSPDIFVAFGPPREPSRRVWKTWEEGKLADFLLEVTSKGTRRKDEEKRRLFERLGVAEYWQHDPTGEYMPAILKGQRLNAAGTYEPIPFTTKPDGTLSGESRVLSLDLCLDEGRLRLFDLVTNEFLATNEEKDDLLAKERELSAQQAREIEELKRRLAAR
ncbi:MAG: Uma2 family endonuclease [Gammaproteobacteria bacterium]|nr:Uma2 family endonuclease [Gammaproteobacteria bacterium]